MSKPHAGMTSNSQSSSGGVLARYEPVIGLEVHCQLMTQSKLFCSCSTKFGAAPNHNTCPVCLGYPGVLPTLNHQAVEFAVKMALAIEATVHETSVFARKQYFYPDLPKGYQITQFDQPYCTNGRLELANEKVVTIQRIHMEEDAGKNIHEGLSSYVDLNRAGMPLIEIVTAPEIGSPEEAADYLRRLHSLVRYLGICDGNMEEGSFRCDANVSLRPRGATQLGTRCEIKNLNSFRNIEKAITYEILRQADILDAGGHVIQQTMMFDAASGKTSAMRSKEQSHDYRYFPDPDLPPLRLAKQRVEKISAALPELPSAMARRFKTDYGLSAMDASVLTSERELAFYFEEVVRLVGDGVQPKIAANWVLTEFLREVREHQWDLASPPLKPQALAELLKLIGVGTISGKIAKSVFEQMATSGGDPRAIVESKGLTQVSDKGAIELVIDKVLEASPDQVAQYLSGKDKVYGFFVGQIMKLSQGKLNPALVNDILKEKLDARRTRGS